MKHVPNGLKNCFLSRGKADIGIQILGLGMLLVTSFALSKEDGQLIDDKNPLHQVQTSTQI